MKSRLLLTLVISLCALSLNGMDTKHSLQHTAATNAAALSAAALCAPITGELAARLSLDPTAPTRQEKADIKDTSMDLFTLNNRPFTRKQLEQSRIFKAITDSEKANTDIPLVTTKLKSVSLDELGKFLEIISMHADKKTCMRELQAQMQMYANADKLADICDVADYFYIPHLLDAVIPLLANEVERTRTALDHTRTEKVIDRCSDFRPEIQRLINASYVNHHPVAQFLTSHKAFVKSEVLQHENFVLNVAWHPTNPSILASASDDGTVRIWDTSRKTDPCVQTLTGHTIVRSIAWHPTNPSLLASASDDGTVRIWDISRKTNPCVQTLTGHEKSVFSVAWHPTHPSLLASASDDNTVRIWDTSRKTDHCVQTLTGHKSWVSSVAWHPTHPSLLASASWDNTVRIWDTSQKTDPCVQTLTGHKDYVTSIAWHPTHPSLLASASWDNTVRIWDRSRKTDPCVQMLTGHEKFVFSVAWHPTHPSLLASASHDTTVRIWDLSLFFTCPKELNNLSVEQLFTLIDLYEHKDDKNITPEKVDKILNLPRALAHAWFLILRVPENWARIYMARHRAQRYASMLSTSISPYLCADNKSKD